MSEDKRKCLKCGKEKPTWAFRRNGRLKDGIDIYCDECRNTRSVRREKAGRPDKPSVAYSLRVYIPNLIYLENIEDGNRNAWFNEAIKFYGEHLKKQK